MDPNHLENKEQTEKKQKKNQKKNKEQTKKKKHVRCPAPPDMAQEQLFMRPCQRVFQFQFQIYGSRSSRNIIFHNFNCIGGCAVVWQLVI